MLINVTKGWIVGTEDPGSTVNGTVRGTKKHGSTSTIVTTTELIPCLPAGCPRMLRTIFVADAKELFVRLSCS